MQINWFNNTVSEWAVKVVVDKAHNLFVMFFSIARNEQTMK